MKQIIEGRPSTNAAPAGEPVKARGDFSYAERRRVSRALIVVAYMIGAIAIPSLGDPFLSRSGLRDDVHRALCFGIAAGQIAFLAAWLALGPGLWAVRLVESLAGTLTLYFGVLVIEGGIGHDPVNLVGFPCAVLSCALLFLLPRWAFYWRLVRAEDRYEPARRQYSIRAVLVWTTVIALALALGRTTRVLNSVVVYAPMAWLAVLPLVSLVGVPLAPTKRLLYFVPSFVLILAVWTWLNYMNAPGAAINAFIIIFSVAGSYFVVLLLLVRLAGYQLWAQLPWRRGMTAQPQGAPADRTYGAATDGQP